MVADVCRGKDSMVELVAKAFLVLAWDPAKEVSEKRIFQQK